MKTKLKLTEQQIKLKRLLTPIVESIISDVDNNINVIPPFKITSDVKTVIETNIDGDLAQYLQDMLDSGECRSTDEIIFDYQKDKKYRNKYWMDVWFKNGGQIDEYDSQTTIQKIYKNRSKLEIYQ